MNRWLMDRTSWRTHHQMCD